MSLERVARAQYFRPTKTSVALVLVSAAVYAAALNIMPDSLPWLDSSILSELSLGERRARVVPALWCSWRSQNLPCLLKEQTSSTEADGGLRA